MMLWVVYFLGWARSAFVNYSFICFYFFVPLGRTHTLREYVCKGLWHPHMHDDNVHEYKYVHMDML